MQALLSMPSTLLHTRPHRQFTTINNFKSLKIATRPKDTVAFHQWAKHGRAVVCGNKVLHCAAAHMVKAEGTDGEDHERRSKRKCGKCGEGPVGASVAMACVLGLGSLCMGRPMCEPAHGQIFQDFFKKPEKSQSLLQALMEIDREHFLKEDELKEAEKKFAELLPKSGRDLDFRTLRDAAQKLEVNPGRIENALTKLREAHSIKLRERQFQEAYELGLMLVEMLIYNGEYEGARNVLLQHDYLLEEGPTDERPHIYNAVISIMLVEREDEVKKHWETAMRTRKKPFSREYGKDPVNFEEFKKKMQDLRIKIERNRSLYKPVKQE